MRTKRERSNQAPAQMSRRNPIAARNLRVASVPAMASTEHNAIGLNNSPAKAYSCSMPLSRIFNILIENH